MNRFMGYFAYLIIFILCAIALGLSLTITGYVWLGAWRVWSMILF